MILVVDCCIRCSHSVVAPNMVVFRSMGSPSPIVVLNVADGACCLLEYCALADVSECPDLLEGCKKFTIPKRP